jgi:hypothetical protein
MHGIRRERSVGTFAGNLPAVRSMTRDVSPGSRHVTAVVPIGVLLILASRDVFPVREADRLRMAGWSQGTRFG